MQNISLQSMTKFDEQLYVNDFYSHDVKHISVFVVLICPSDESSQPDPNCFRMAREYIWQLIERRFFLLVQLLPQ